MRETETFYWKNETGTIEEHHISEFGTFLETKEGRCVTAMEYQQKQESYPQPPTTYRQMEREVVDQGSAPEKEVV